MGSGIAQVAAGAGLAVVLYDVAGEMLGKALDQIKESAQRAVQKARMTEDEAEALLGRITATTATADFKDCHVVIEAIPEQLEIKRAFFQEIGGIVSEDAILATNTSTLSVTAIAAACPNPARVVGMHFFNPPTLMPLVEVIGGSATSEETIAETIRLTERMGKTPVRAKDTPGFIANRVARPFYLEALRILGEGVADHVTIDRLAREGGGFRMGPFELMDLIGLDINYAASRSVYEAYFQEPRFRPSVLQQRMVESGRLGRKTGRGWYDYGQK